MRGRPSGLLWMVRSYAAVYNPEICGVKSVYRPYPMTLKRLSIRVIIMAPKRANGHLYVNWFMIQAYTIRNWRSLDALHCNPLTLNAVHGAKGVYAVGLKCNQLHLYRYCICTCLVHTAEYERSDTLQGGHGRIDQRQYECFRIYTLALAARWNNAGICTLIRVKRRRQGLDGSWKSEQVSYFLSNARPTNLLKACELFDAIRQHWRIEAMHYRRDITLAEDARRTGSQALSRLMSSLRTLTINLLRRAQPKNMAAQIEEFADKFHTLIQFMTQELVL